MSGSNPACFLCSSFSLSSSFLTSDQTLSSLELKLLPYVQCGLLSTRYSGYELFVQKEIGFSLSLTFEAGKSHKDS